MVPAVEGRVLLLHVHWRCQIVDDVEQEGSRHTVDKGTTRATALTQSQRVLPGEGRPGRRTSSNAATAQTTMLKRLALALIGALSLLSTISLASASADDASVELTPSAATFAAGADAMFHVTLSGDTDIYSLDYVAEGGTVSGALALNELGDGRLAGSVFVRRDAPGSATLIASHEGMEVARSTAAFVEGAPVTVEVTLQAGPDAAARTWFFDILDASGTERAFVQVSTSGDRPTFAVASQSLPFGDYTVRPGLNKDIAGDCSGSAFFALTPAEGASVTVSSGGASVAFAVRTCASESVPQGGDAGEAAASQGQGDPLPPSTGNGSQETPQLREWQANQLARLLLGIAGATVPVIVLTRFLVRVAPLKVPEKKK